MLLLLYLQNAFPVAGLFTTHLLSLDALLAVINSIEQHCHHRVLHTSAKGDARSGANRETRADASSTTQQSEGQLYYLHFGIVLRSEVVPHISVISRIDSWLILYITTVTCSFVLLSAFPR